MRRRPPEYQPALASSWGAEAIWQEANCSIENAIIFVHKGALYPGFAMWNKLKKIPRQVYIKYGLLAIPSTVALILVLMVVHYWVPIPYWIWITLILLWVVKEIVLFPLVWRAYDPTRSNPHRSMIDKKGITRERLAPTGFIQIEGELWKAGIRDNHPPIEKGSRVRVINIDGLKLSVVAEKSENSRLKTENGTQMQDKNGSRWQPNRMY